MLEGVASGGEEGQKGVEDEVCRCLMREYRGCLINETAFQYLLQADGRASPDKF